MQRDLAFVICAMLTAVLTQTRGASANHTPPLAPTPAAEAAPLVGDPDTLRLALKFVQFLDANNQPALTEEAAQTLTAEINRLYAPCKIEFRIEEYLPVAAQSRGLQFNTQTMNELDPIRAQFDSQNQLLIVNTGTWDHAGMGSANAWTTMPGQTPSGAVIEAPVANFAGIVAHELGHYLSLDHGSNARDLMNPIIYKKSTRLNRRQCSAMRKSAKTVRTAALR